MAAPRVLVVGGGVGGLALAFWLGRLGHRVTVVERYPELRAKGQQIDIRGQGIDVLRRMGLLDAVRAKCVAEQGILFVDSLGRQRAFFGANLSGKGRQSFTSEYEIMRGDLCRILHEPSSTTDNVQFVYGTTVDSMEQDETDTEGPVRAKLSDGTERSFDLVVGADGQNSRTRLTVLDVPKGAKDPSLTSLGLYAAFFAVAQLPSDRPVATFNLAPGRRATFTRVDNPQTTQVYYLLHAEHRGAAEFGDALERRDVDAQRRIMADAMEDGGWQNRRFARALRDRAPETEDFYATDMARVRCRVLTRGRVTLLGDAGYSPASASGYGTTAALIGAYVLAGELASHTTTGVVDVSAALQAYEDRLRPMMESWQEIPAWSFKLFLPESAWGVAVFHWVVGLIAFLRVDKLFTTFSSDNYKGWDLPDYPALGISG